MPQVPIIKMKYSTVFAVLVAAASALPSLLPRQEKNARAVEDASAVEDVVASFNALSQTQQADALSQLAQANRQAVGEQNADAQAVDEQNADGQAAAEKDAAAQDAKA